MTMAENPIFKLTPDDFTAHPLLHGSAENFRETNCYSDLIIEMIHASGLNPIACLGYTLASDLEGDQWTFGKPSHHDLEVLYGIRVEELSLYRPLPDQLVTQVSRGSIPLLEADAFHLPDVAGIDYRTNHVKTTIGITHVDVEKKRMYYFHNATFDKLEGEDFDGVVKPLIAAQKGYLPPYCEIAKLDRLQALDDDALRQHALSLAKHHFAKRPEKNPFLNYMTVIEAHQQAIIEHGEAAYHAYTFVAPRQLGAAHQLGAHFLRWLGNGQAPFVEAANAFDQIAVISKSLVLKLARVSFTGRPADLSGLITNMAEQWEIASQQLKQAFSHSA
jgi:hypothetical protein